MDEGNDLVAMKAELARMRHEKICLEARLRAAGRAVEEKKRVLAEFKAIEKLANDLLLVYIGTIESGPDNVHENNGQNPDDETMKALIEEAMREFTEALNVAQSRESSLPADGRNGGDNEHDGRSTDQNLNGTDKEKETRANGGCNKGCNGGGQA